MEPLYLTSSMAALMLPERPLGQTSPLHAPTTIPEEPSNVVSPLAASTLPQEALNLASPLVASILAATTQPEE